MNTDLYINKQLIGKLQKTHYHTKTRVDIIGCSNYALHQDVYDAFTKNSSISVVANNWKFTGKVTRISSMLNSDDTFTFEFSFTIESEK